MSATPSPVAPLTPAASERLSIKPGQVLIVGKLMGCRRPSGQGHYWSHLVVMPAPDAYSSPSTVEILATRRLGEKEEEVRILCRVSGYRRSYKATDRETGEIINRQTADNKLFAIED